MIESTTCPACSTELLIEIRAQLEGKIFEFPSGIKINCSEVRCGIKNIWTKRVKFDRIKQYLLQKLLCRPVDRQTSLTGASSVNPWLMTLSMR